MTTATPSRSTGKEREGENTRAVQELGNFPYFMLLSRISVEDWTWQGRKPKVTTKITDCKDMQGNPCK